MELPIVFFGSDDFSLSHLQFLLSDFSLSVRVRLVVTGSSTTPVANFCWSVGRTCLVWPRNSSPIAFEHVVDAIKRLNCSDNRLLGIVASFGRFLPRCVVENFSVGVINVHPSLLPRWRGSAPIFHTLVTGDTVTGVSVVRIISSESGRFDHGPILQQKVLQIPQHLHPISASNLLAYLTPHCLKLLSKVLLEVLECGQLVSRSLPVAAPASPRLACRPRSEMALVSWFDQSASDIRRLWYAISDWFTLSTTLTLELPVTDKYHSVLWRDASCSLATLKVGFHTSPVIVWPHLADENVQLDIQLKTLNTVQDKLCQLDPQLAPSGSIVFIEDNIVDSRKRRSHPSLARLIPMVFVACRNTSSWLGVTSFVIGHPQGRRRPLSATEFYSGYFTSRPCCWRVQEVIPSVWIVGTFSSSKNPLWPLPQPLIDIV